MKHALQSLELELSEAPTDTERADILNRHAEEMLNPDVYLSMQLAFDANQLSRQINYKQGIAHAVNILGGCYYRLTNNERAIESAEEALKLCLEIGYDDGAAFALNTIGATSIIMGNHVRALESFIESLAIRTSINNQQGIATSLMNIGNVYQSLGDQSKALDYYLKSLSLREEIDDKSGVGTSLTNIGNCYVAFGELSTALEYFHKSLSIKEELDNRQGLIGTLHSIAEVHLALQNNETCIEFAQKSYGLAVEMTNKLGESNALHCIGLALEQKDDFPSALDYYTRSLTIRREIHNPAGEAGSLLSIGTLLVKLGAVDTALSHLFNALKIAKTIQSKILMYKVNQALADLYHQVGDFAKAYMYFTEYFKLKEEALGDEAKKNIQNLQAIHQVEQARKEAEIYRLRNTELAELNKNLLELNNEKNEFLGIAAHDLKNPLAGIMLTASTVKQHFRQMPGDEIIGQMETIEKTADRMRRIITNLLDIYSIESGKLNLAIKHFDLSKLVASLVKDFRKLSKAKNIEIHFTPPTQIIFVLADYNATIEILENLISNALKFSHKSGSITIQLSLHEEYSTARLEIIDSGQGFSDDDKLQLFGKFMRLSARPTDGEDSTGLGLYIVKKLVEAMNGRINCESELGKGAKFIVELPL
ncbi:MAG: tetratricopeptide repeat-containing sensor histidine kinase [Bacteroidetes bacterium]|nr:tetratricopeptide repeat-containing sensor histidine kinase [Bacteroidota bacterium]